ncbi:MAG: GNAT family N-acetyltransferase [Chloroflexota bacterium]
MIENLKIELREGDALTRDEKVEIITFCNRAYQEDLEPLFKVYPGATHVIGYFGNTMVSHAMWVTRWLQAGNSPLLRTAYVEMVATAPEFQRRGFATAIMQELAKSITDFDLGALCPAKSGLYARLGWVYWRGPLYIRSTRGLVPTPEERVMILRLPKTPQLDLDEGLSAEWREGELW